MKEDPTRDPASEARDDHASEPRATPETDALVPSQGRIRTMREYIEELEAHALSLERQRDELLDSLYAIEERFVDGCDTYDDWKFMGETARAAIAAVKGGTP